MADFQVTQDHVEASRHLNKFGIIKATQLLGSESGQSIEV